MRVTPNQLNILKLSGDSQSLSPPLDFIELSEASSVIRAFMRDFGYHINTM